MTFEERKEQVEFYLGKVIDIKIDRPIGYVHHKQQYSLTYPINYGYIPDVIGGDGEELDVYLLGVFEPVKEYTARIIGIVHRENDNEDKLITVPDGIVFTKEEIKKAVAFQEQYYDTHIETCDINFYECTAQHCGFTGLSETILNKCYDKLSVYFENNHFKLYSEKDYDEFQYKLDGAKNRNACLRFICNNTEIISNERSLFLSIFHASKRDNQHLSSDAVFHLRFTECMDFIEIEILNIQEPKKV